MYKEIDTRPSIPDKYAAQLINEGILSEEEKKQIIEEHTENLLKEFRAIEQSTPQAKHLEGNWQGFQQAPKAYTKWDTGVDADLLRYVGEASVKAPSGFNLNKHLQKTHCEARISKMINGEGIDWGTAEALAFGSLLLQVMHSYKI